MDYYFNVYWVSRYTGERKEIDFQIETREDAIKIATEHDAKQSRIMSGYAGFAYIDSVFHDSDYDPEPSIHYIVSEGKVLFDDNAE